MVTAYLNADLKEMIFISAPPGFVGDESNKILRLKKSLYGLKQSGRNWNDDLIGTFRSIGYTVSEYSDLCLLTRRTESDRLITWTVFVDDLNYTYHPCDEKEMERDLVKLKAKYKITDLGDTKHLLGMKVDYDFTRGILNLTQRPFIADIE